MRSGYFETTFDFVPPVCDYVAGTCTTRFKRRSECRPLLAAHAGNTFMTNDVGQFDATQGYATLNAQPLVVNGLRLTTAKDVAFVRYSTTPH